LGEQDASGWALRTMNKLKHLSGETLWIPGVRSTVLGVVIYLLFAVACHAQSPSCPVLDLGLEFAGQTWALSFEGKQPPAELQHAIADDLRRVLLISAPQIRILTGVPGQRFAMCDGIRTSHAAIACPNCPRWHVPGLLRKGRFGYALPPSRDRETRQWKLIVSEEAVKAYQAVAAHEQLARDAAEFARRWNAGLIVVTNWKDILYHLSQDQEGMTSQDLQKQASELREYKFRIPSRLDYFLLKDGENTFSCYKTALWGKSLNTVLDNGAICRIQGRWLFPTASGE
jgi:hypothetical protein